MARQYPTLTRNGFLLPERIKASYEGAGEGRRSASWDAPDIGINSINTPALRNLRARSRAAVRNDPYAFNVIDKRVSNLIGSLDNYDDAVLFRQEVANLFAGFISRPPPEATQQPRDPVTGQLLTEDRDGFTPMVALEPGTMQELGPGEEVEFSKPPDAGNNYPDFMRQQLMAAAAGTGTPYEILTGDMREVNDRALRVVLNEFRRRLEQLQFGVYVHQLCRPVRAAWMDMAVLAGRLKLDDYAQRRREYLRTRWVPQGWAYIQPVQDIQARMMEVNAGFNSRSEMVLRSGYDAETVDAENAADQARARDLGLNYKTLVDQPETVADKETP